MSTREEARQGLMDAVDALVATFPTPLDVDRPNILQIDPAKQVRPFLKVWITYQGAWQASMSSDKHTRAVGHLVLEAWVNPGKGTKLANDMLQHFFPALQMTDEISGVRTYAASFLESYTKVGWDVTPIIIPFWFDSIY